MARTVRCGLIQSTNAGPTDLPIQEIKKLNIEKHLGPDSAGRRARSADSLHAGSVYERHTFAPSNRHAGMKRSKRFPTARPPT